jgi:hypothetical protein
LVAPVEVETGGILPEPEFLGLQTLVEVGVVVGHKAVV